MIGSTTITTAPTNTLTTSSGPMNYDLSIGMGVDADGFAQLPLRGGAYRYFVSSATGSDTNGCLGSQQAAKAMRTIAAAVACVRDGSGDQVLLAEGTSYAEGLPSLNSKSGYNPQYPSVIQSYDPSDPLNEAKYGRGDQRGARPRVNTGAGEQTVSGGMGTVSPQYLAIRGLDFSAGNVGGISLNFVPGASGVISYLLIESNLFRYTSLSLDMATSTAGNGTNLVIRNNAFYGGWSSTDKGGGIYYDTWDGVTIEDNVIWHVGWKIGASRDDAASIGGPNIFKHSIYQQTRTYNTRTRRNLIVDGPADGGQFRGDSVVTENVFIDNPISASIGGGTSYNIYRPTGVSLEFAFNAILGDADINSSNPRGIAIAAANGRSGSSVHHNLIARSRNMSGENTYAFSNAVDFPQPSYMSWDKNVIYQWAIPNSTWIDGGSDPARGIYNFSTRTTNIWDAATLGTNTYNGSVTFPKPYTAAELYTALGYVNKQAFINDVIARPEAHIQRSARSLLITGYGMSL